jgi:parallel beta-helix repeat protein
MALILVFPAGATAIMVGMFLLSDLSISAQTDASVLCVAPDGVGCDPARCGIPCYATVQRAVDVADYGDLIKIASGVYTGVQSHPAPLSYNGPSEVAQVVYLSKTITIRGGYTATNWAESYPLTQPTVLDARGGGRVFFVVEAVSPTVENVYVTGGDATGLEGSPSGANTGGGIYVFNATLRLKNVQLFGNTAGQGGGLYVLDSPVTLYGNSVFSNTAQVFGGGVYIESGDSTLLQKNEIVSNTGSTGGGGVAVVSSSNVILRDNVIDSNIARQFGGGVFLYGANGATMSGNSIVDNSGWVYGGGVSVWFSDQVLLSDNTFHKNSSGTGGGFYIRDSSYAKFRDNILSSNSASRGGGGFVFYSYYSTMHRNTIRDNNVSRDAGGLFLWHGHNATLSSNIVISNVAQNGGGGVYFYNCDNVTLDNTVVAGNRAELTGGGLFFSGGNYHLRHMTFARNDGGDGSGVFATTSGLDASSVALTNTILVSHTVGVTVTMGNTATLNTTLWQGNTEADWGGAGVVIPSNDKYGDPLFLDPGSGNYHIDSESVAVDLGEFAGVMTDIDNEPRFGQNPDLGADEYWAPGQLKRIYLTLVLRLD